MGYDGLFLGRIDYQDKANRLKKMTAEMVWQASEALGRNADIFTGALYNTYSPPPGFCFDILCTDEPIIDNKHSTEYNVDRRVSQRFHLIGVVFGRSRTYPFALITCSVERIRSIRF